MSGGPAHSLVRTLHVRLHHTPATTPLSPPCIVCPSVPFPILVSGSKSGDPSMSTESIGEQAFDVSGMLTHKINCLRNEIQAERVATIREKVENNRKRLESNFSLLVSSTVSETNVLPTGSSATGNMLSSRIENPLCFLSGHPLGAGDKDTNIQEVTIPVCAKLQLVDKIPHYTTWSFLSRNQRMAVDQSVVGGRQIYYDREQGSEALIYYDSEQEIGEPEKEKHEFVEAEDRIIRMVMEEFEAPEEKLAILTQFIDGSTSEIQERWTILQNNNVDKCNVDGTRGGEVANDKGIDLDKSLNASLDSLDNLFCRRCLVFDCHLHGYSQSLILPSEKHVYSSEFEEEREPCGDHCYLQLNKLTEQTDGGALSRTQRTTLDEEWEPSVGSSGEVEVVRTSTNAAMNLVGVQTEIVHNSCQWKTLEKELYLKGVEIYGRNSCLIARNLLAGLKTCIEVSKYMDGGESALSQRCLAAGFLFGDKEAGGDHKEGEMPSRSRFLRKRGRTRKLKYSRKTAGYPGAWKRIGDGKDELCRHYSPCECDSLCGKNCPCVDSKTCCEKYCGCAKSCKNRFRGCHCEKSQCRSRQCPCIAAQRECDPDVCRNCWLSCGDGSLGEPPRRGDGQCGNMRLLQKQHRRILLGKSDIAGWGAFSKNPVEKNEILGEYTGELISHREADKRGKIYDRTNSSYLFDLDDHYVLDAYRKGDKLKFANHSANPNCYARIMLVSGDHRVGIFSKRTIEAGEELFYDYHYKPDSRPLWVRKLLGIKEDETTTPQGRAKKSQSQQ